MTNYFSSNLKYLRELKRISQNKLAELSGISQATINRWESDKMSPSLDNVNDIAKVLDVSVGDLLGKDLNEDTSFSQLDEVLFSKAKDLSDEDKKVIINVINSIKKDIDKEDND